MIEFDKWLTSENGRQALIDAGGGQAQAMRSAWNAGFKLGQNLSSTSSGRDGACGCPGEPFKINGLCHVCGKPRR